MSDLFGGFSPSQINDHSGKPTIDRILLECGLSDRLKNLIKNIFKAFEGSEPSMHFESAVAIAGKERDERGQLKVFNAEYCKSFDSPPLWSSPYAPDRKKYRLADLYQNDDAVRETDSVRDYPTLYAQLIKESVFSDDPLGFFGFVKEKSNGSSDPLIDCMRLYDSEKPYDALFDGIEDLPENIEDVERIIWRQDPLKNISYFKLIPECMKASLAMHKCLLDLNMIEEAIQFEDRCRSYLIKLEECQNYQDYICRMSFQRLSDPANRTTIEKKREWIALSYICGVSFHDGSLPAGKEIEYIDECLKVADWESHPKHDICFSNGCLTVSVYWKDDPIVYKDLQGCLGALENFLPVGLVIRLLKSKYSQLVASRIPCFLQKMEKEVQIKAVQVLFAACCPPDHGCQKRCEEPWFAPEWSKTWCQILLSDDQWKEHYQKLIFILDYIDKQWLDQEWVNLYTKTVLDLGAPKGALWNEYCSLAEWIRFVKVFLSEFNLRGKELVHQADRLLFLLRHELASDDALSKIKSAQHAYSILLTYAPEKLLANLLMALRKSDVPCSGQGLEFGAGDNLVAADLYKNPAHWWLSIMISNCLRVEYGWNDVRNFPGRSDGPPEGYNPDITMVLRTSFAEFCWKSLRLQKGDKCETGYYSDEQCTEQNALWREAFVYALSEIGLDLGGKVHKTLFFVREHDPVQSVREAAKKAYKAVRRQHHHNEDEPIKGLLIAFWMLRLAQRSALGEPIDQNEATRSRRNEIRYADQVREVYRLLIK